MVTPLITASTRYFDVGLTVVYYLPAVANTSAPTRAEMDAGTNLSREIAEIDGWSVTSNTIETPDLSTKFVSQIGGRIEAADSSLTFYASSNSVDVRNLLPRDTTGFIMWLDAGDVPTQKADVYPITVRSVSKMRSVGSEAARIKVDFAITRQPAENVTIPA